MAHTPAVIPTQHLPAPQILWPRTQRTACNTAEPKFHTFLRSTPFTETSHFLLRPWLGQLAQAPSFSWLLGETTNGAPLPGGSRNLIGRNEGTQRRVCHVQGLVSNRRHGPLSLGMRARGGLCGEFSGGGRWQERGVQALVPCLSPCSEGGALGPMPSAPWSPWACPGWARCQEHLTSPQG